MIPYIDDQVMPYLAWRQIGATLTSMATIQTKNVPDDVHRVLTERAAKAGQSLQEYVRGILIREAGRPTVNEVLDRAAQSAESSIDRDFIVDTLRRAREA